MDVPLPWYALAIVTTWLNGSTLGFLAWRERHGALRSWAIAWLAWGVAVVPLAALGDPEAHPLIGVLCGLLWVVSTLGFLRGAYQLRDRSVPRSWYAIAGACATLALMLGVGPRGAVGMVPLVLFQSIGLSSTGVVIIRGGRGRAGAWLCGGALVGLGLHVLDAPLLTSHPALFLWGFVVAIALQVLAALGMLMLYYEHARAALLEAQRALEAQRRIEALGRIAGGVAHDFNNMLTVMRAHVELIRVQGETAPGTRASLGAMEDAISRAARLTAQLLAFGRRSVIRPRAIDIADVVADTLELLRKLVPERIELQLHRGEGSYVASLDQALLEQIVLNLVTNARDAIDDQGHIVVELERVDVPSSTVVIRVSDDGAGMDEAVKARVFEPFITSKPEGQGTGLGLASVQGAVSQLGGEVRVESEMGRGSTFEVLLPCALTPGPPSGRPSSAAG